MTAFQYQAQASRVVQTETQKTIQDLLRSSPTYLFISGIVLLIVGKIVKSRG